MSTEPSTPLPSTSEPSAGGVTIPPADAVPTASAPPPRTRWAAIVWGVCFVAIAWLGIAMLSSRGRQEDVADWLAALTPGTITAFLLLLIGVLVLITGAVGLIRRGQRRGSAAR
ncbi:hypothetical protein ACU045_07585 [Microbacterium sp. MAHUQ-60]|uniref:hypothetical protein n=1 Tax=unclassified Microbacterium TaxID=2609290 RepID=UPI00362157A7